MNIDRKSQEELIAEADGLAAKLRSNMRHPEASIIQSNALLIESNARVEGSVGNLTKEIKEFNSKAEKQTKTALVLNWVLTVLTAVLVFLTVVLLR